jgi:hypothetical protein
VCAQPLTLSALQSNLKLAKLAIEMLPRYYKLRANGLQARKEALALLIGGVKSTTHLLKLI